MGVDDGGTVFNKTDAALIMTPSTCRKGKLLLIDSLASHVYCGSAMVLFNSEAIFAALGLTK